MPNQNLIHRCAICHSIEMPDGKLLTSQEYKPEQLSQKGYQFVDTPRSIRCIDNWIKKIGFTPRYAESIRADMYRKISAVSCPEYVQKMN